MHSSILPHLLEHPGRQLLGSVCGPYGHNRLRQYWAGVIPARIIAGVGPSSSICGLIRARQHHSAHPSSTKCMVGPEKRAPLAMTALCTLPP